MEVSDLISCHSEKSKYDNNRDFIIAYHNTQMDDYYHDAEHLCNVFWDNDTIFKNYFNELDLRFAVELACGHGRHVPFYIDKTEELILVDAVDSNIEYCRRRFKEYRNISFIVNNGYDLQDIPSKSQTCLFTYDAMIHFELLDIAYLYYICYLLCTGMYARLPKQMENVSTKTILQNIDWDSKALEMLNKCDEILDEILAELDDSFQYGNTFAVLSDVSE